jgi:hypothetical protein
MLIPGVTKTSCVWLIQKPLAASAMAEQNAKPAVTSMREAKLMHLGAMISTFFEIPSFTTIEDLLEVNVPSLNRFRRAALANLVH